MLVKAAPSPGQFQDVEGETEERRRARLERHQRTQERAVCIICPQDGSHFTVATAKAE